VFQRGHWAGWRINGYLPLCATDPQMKFPQLLYLCRIWKLSKGRNMHVIVMLSLTVVGG